MDRVLNASVQILRPVFLHRFLERRVLGPAIGKVAHQRGVGLAKVEERRLASEFSLQPFSLQHFDLWGIFFYRAGLGGCPPFRKIVAHFNCWHQP